VEKRTLLFFTVVILVVLKPPFGPPDAFGKIAEVVAILPTAAR
jgi:hypothetical protein